MDQLINYLNTTQISALLQTSIDHIIALLKANNIAQLSITSATSFTLIAAAEIGARAVAAGRSLSLPHTGSAGIVGAFRWRGRSHSQVRRKWRRCGGRRPARGDR